MKKVTAITLALLVLVSSQGFAINTHFCGGKVVETSLSIVIQNLNCGMTELLTDCEPMTSCDVQLKSKPCCNNKHKIAQLDQNILISNVQVSMNLDIFVTLVHVFSEPVFLFQSNINRFSRHPPPRAESSVQVLLQTFLL